MSCAVLVCTHCGEFADMRHEEARVMGLSGGDVSFVESFNDELQKHDLHLICPGCLRTDGWMWCKSVPTTEQEMEHLRIERIKHEVTKHQKR